MAQSFLESLDAAGVKYEKAVPSEPIPDALPVKCLLVTDKKKQPHLVVQTEAQFDGIKKLMKDLGLKDLRFVPLESVSAAGEVPSALTPRILGTEAYRGSQVHLEAGLEGKRLLFKTALSDELALMEVGQVLAYLRWLKVEDSVVTEFTPGKSDVASSPAKQTDAKTKAEPKPKAVSKTVDPDKALIGITVEKRGDFSEWYTQVITKAEMIEYYDVSGCYILRPWAFQIWERIQGFLDFEFKQRGAQNSYFPTFVTKQRLEAEQNHIEGFSAEVAWVTKSGQSDLAEPIAIRPTSETIMYPAFARWIRSHRDLPLKLNQWCSVVRWEFKQPTPFIRTREFLWQEGHTAHTSEAEADAYARDILSVYVAAYESLLAVPVCPGQKSEVEKFAGGFKTYSVEGYIPTNGRGLQCATSHNLGQNFSKMFGIEFEDQERNKQHVWQTSWGFTTRSVGAMIMVHGDDKGLVLPPRVAPIQVVIVPILYKDENPALYNEACDQMTEQLRSAGVRVENDNRVTYNPGWKYNHWELKGVPIRIEIGPRDLKNGTARIVRRYNGEKTDVNRDEIAHIIPQILDDIHTNMLNKARQDMNSHIIKIRSFSEVMPVLNARNLVLAPWCREDECEEAAKEETAKLAAEDGSGMTGAMKTLCMPFDQPEMEPGMQCFRGCGPAKVYALWGRSY